MFKSKRRIASAWAKGLMLGKAVGARDERDRIVERLVFTELQLTNGEFYSEARLIRDLIEFIKAEND